MLYFFQTTGLVVNNISLETAKCDSSTASELEAFKIAIAEAHEMFGDQLKVVCTDGHMGIAACMRELAQKYGIRHALDMWHFIKTMTKYITRTCTLKVSRPQQMSAVCVRTLSVDL